MAWVMTTMVRPLRERSRSSSIISRSRSGDSPLVGSSRKMTLGSASSSMAMDARLRCPPEREDILTRSLPVRRTSRMASRTRLMTASFFMEVFILRSAV